MCVMSHFVVLQFLAIEWTHKCRLIISRSQECSWGEIHRRGTSSRFLGIEPSIPWKDEDHSLPRVVHERLSVGYQCLECVKRLEMTTWLACVCSRHQWLTRSQRTWLPVLTFRIAGLWIVDVLLHSTTRIDHDHPSVLDVLVLYGIGQLFVIRRSRHRICTSRFLRDDYSLHRSDERCDVWNGSNPWCTRSDWEFRSPIPLVCHSRCKERGQLHPPSACIPESSWIDHTCPRSCHRI